MIWNCVSAFYKESVKFKYETETNDKNEFLIELLNNMSIRAIVAAVSHKSEIINDPSSVKVIENPFNSLTISVGEGVENIVFFNPVKSE